MRRTHQSSELKSTSTGMVTEDEIRSETYPRHILGDNPCNLESPSIIHYGLPQGTPLLSASVFNTKNETDNRNLFTVMLRGFSAPTVCSAKSYYCYHPQSV